MRRHYWYLFVPRQLKSSLGDAPRRPRSKDSAVQSECTKRTLLCGREGADSAPALLYLFVPLKCAEEVT